MADVVRITATGAGLSYYPEFVARHLGFFEDEGVTVETEAPGYGHWAPSSVRNGTADLALGGIWRPILYRDKLDHFMPFACIVQRCPVVLLSREPRPDFAWGDLVGQRVAIGEGAPSPFIAVFATLRAKGVDPASVNFVTHFMAQEARDFFLSGICDFYIVAAPASDALVAEGAGHQVASFVAEAGALPWSVYYSLPAFLTERRGAAERFAAALQRALNWIHAHDPEEAMVVLERSWPGVPAAVTLKAARDAKALGMWPRTVRLEEDQLERWQKILVESRLFDAPVAYDEIFAEGPSLAAIAKYPPAGG